MTTATITKKQLVDLGADKGLISRFIEQTGNTDQAVNVLSLICGKNTTADLLWFAGKTLPKIKIVQFAVECAESVSHLNNNPSDNAAIQSANDWIRKPCEENRLNARNTANYAAYAASNALNAAYPAAFANAANAAYASYYAAKAAYDANAANAAYNAAYYAANAANAAYDANADAFDPNYAAYAAYVASNRVVQASLRKLFS
ncbi:MAG: hypothetical protein ACJAYB_000065 [Psychromonas sp.]|jgi:hypothetical protein